MSRKPAPIKIIDLEDGMPKVEEARLRMQRELLVARQQGYAAVKLIHGYGSSGVGGSLRIELQKELHRLAGAPPGHGPERADDVRGSSCFMPGGDLRTIGALAREVTAAVAVKAL